MNFGYMGSGFGRLGGSAKVALSGADPHFDNVVLLVGFDGIDAATVTSDESPVARSLTFVGNAQIDTAQSKFGGSSLLLGAAGDRVTATDSADWILRAGAGEPFTIEAWVRPSALNANYHFIVAQWLATGDQRAWAMGISGNTGGDPAAFLRSTNGATVSPIINAGSGVFAVNTWAFAAVDFDGTTYRYYVDGAMVGSATDAGEIFNSTALLTIGAQDDGGQQYLGHIDEVRITKGVARYASDGGFEVPTEAFPRY